MANNKGKKSTENKRKRPTERTIKKLYACSGNLCAFPGCKTPLFNHEDDSNLSNICHIADAKPSKAGRYDPKMSDEERAAYENLILLCPTHHKFIDTPGPYSAEELKEMKRKHEAKVLQALADQNLISEYTSALNTVINRLGSTLLGDPDIPVPTNAPKTVEKISYNHITDYKFVIEQYSVYQGKLGKIYEEIEAEGARTKHFLLQNIKTIYLREKGKYPNLNELRANSDNIIESVKNKLFKIADNSANQDKDLPYEAIEVSLLIIIVDAFIRCDILEAPPEA